MAELVILIVDEAVGRHVAAALRAHLRELRRSGLPVPSMLADLAAICASGGLARTTFDNAESADDAARMDQLAVDFRAAGGRLGVSDRSIRRLVDAGELPAVLVAGCKRIRTSDLMDYVTALPAVDKKAAA